MKLWSGRFAAGQHPALDAINRSLDFDVRLWPYDIAGSRAHATMLGDVGLLDAAEVRALLQALDTVEAELREGQFAFLPADEDVHTAVERRVTELVDDAGRKLHTARSRNDQVATDVRLFALDAIAALHRELAELCRALLDLAERHDGVALPAYTHLQRGQPVLLAHHLLAWVEMLRRDHDRLTDAARRTRVSPLGSGACAGTSLPIDREATARALGFDALSRNSLDAVSDRDFVLELLSALAILMVHISRMGEELVLWSSAEFAYCRPADAVSTGSSMMPQKKNPDGAELMRGKAGRVFGALMTLLTAMKGLPLAYNKDMQEDKEPLFDAVDTARLGLAMATAMFETLEIDAAAMRRAISPDVFATDLAERLVARGVPLRTAHSVVAGLVRRAEAAGKSLAALDQSDLVDTGELAAASVSLDDLRSLTLEASLAGKRVPGGTAPERVREALAEARAWVTAAART
jgi:argininosuccinate lyase